MLKGNFFPDRGAISVPDRDESDVVYLREGQQDFTARTLHLSLLAHL